MHGKLTTPPLADNPAMPNAQAVFSRVMQFREGPQAATFYVCAKHLPYLESGDVSGGNFFVTDDEPVQPFDAAEEQLCDMCREGG